MVHVISSSSGQYGVLTNTESMCKTHIHRRCGGTLALLFVSASLCDVKRPRRKGERGKRRGKSYLNRVRRACSRPLSYRSASQREVIYSRNACFWRESNSRPHPVPYPSRHWFASPYLPRGHCGRARRDSERKIDFLALQVQI